MMTERKYVTDGLRTGNWLKSGLWIESQVSKKISGFKENKRIIFFHNSLATLGSLIVPNPELCVLVAAGTPRFSVDHRLFGPFQITWADSCLLWHEDFGRYLNPFLNLSLV